MKKIGLTILVLLMSIILISCKSDKIQIGILQYVTHDDLDDARLGIVEVLKDNGFIDGDNVKIEVLNPQTDGAIMQTQAKSLVRKSDLLIGIATPAAIALKNEIEKQGKNTPLLFTAVTDPVDADLVFSMDDPKFNVTGTSDMNPIEKQLSLVKRIKKDAKTLGILYTAGEPNSLVQANLAEDEAKALGLKVEKRAITQASEINQTFRTLAGLSDVIYIPSDNLISSSMGNIEVSIENNKERQVPVIATTIFQVEDGASITYGFSYLELGKQTGEIAVRVLNGEDANDIPVEIIKDVDLVINLKQFKEVLNLELDEELLNEAKIILE